ncbi:response regulator [Parabacteroides bouchesdurhonensis]|uniref:response regulator n=1 Tax=Parabacteroides bouchesdurhonensis TaxID=1936995 RepID=UPI000C817BDE|nr:response regulator [Parabacteroides bouchesdurhonensis]
MLNGKIVLVDDNEAILKSLRIVLSHTFPKIIGVSEPALLPALLRGGDVDVVVLDMNFGAGDHSGGDGLFWLEKILGMDNPPAVVLITAYADIELAVSSLKQGAADFVIKPWDNAKLTNTIIAAYEKRYAVLHPEENALTLDEMEKRYIEEVLAEKKGNLTLCAQQLNISRQTLYNKMKKYNL